MKRLILVVLLMPFVFGFRVAPTACISVPITANLHTVVENGAAESYCLDAGTFQLGTTGLKPDEGDKVYGKPVTFGSKGEVYAQTFIYGTDANGIIQPIGGTAANHNILKWVDICCSPDTNPGTTTGRGINGTARSPQANYLDVIESRLHGNGQAGIAGMKEGLRVVHSELDHDGSGTGGYDAAVKTIYYAVFQNNYVHDGGWNGLWFDCDAPGGVISGNRIEANVANGVHVEISSGDSTSWHPDLPPWANGVYGFTVTNNVIVGNNPSADNGKSGVNIISSRNVTLSTNIIVDNGWSETWIDNDDRYLNNHDHCKSGFLLENVEAAFNRYGPGDLQRCDPPEFPDGVNCHDNTKIK
jgi:hypothetical protein